MNAQEIIHTKRQGLWLALTASTVIASCLLPTPGFAQAPQNPKFVELEVFPKTLELTALRDSRRFIVTGKAEDGSRHDLSEKAKLKSSGSQVTIDRDGFVVPNSVGKTEVTLSAAGLEVKVPVEVKAVDTVPVSFIQDVMPIMSKVGCNAGTCHGSRIGKEGFKLSLRGYDPVYDYRALVDDLSGRRFNRSQPAQSLMLLKPTQGVPHEGGFLFDEDSRPYKLIHQWISEGCRYDTSVPEVVSLEVFPKTPLLQRSGEHQQQIVIAKYADGSSRDVSREAIFEISDFEVATVTKSGKIEAVRRGEAAVLVRYEGTYATNPVTVVGDREGFVWNDSPEYNFVDHQVNNKLKRMKILPSELCTDAEFLRRVSLDLTGLPPTTDQVRAFLSDTRDSKTKRNAKIDELIDGPEFVDHWTLKWSDLLMSNRKYIKEKGVWAFRNWIRNSIATNKPYNQFAYELMTASGSTLENPAANYFRIAREPKIVMENMTQVFIGTRFMCCQCHDHPFERWTQTNYYELSAFFSSVGRKAGSSVNEEIIYSLRTSQPVVHAGTGQVVAASFPFTHEGYNPDKTTSPSNQRDQLAGWLTAKENPYFATSLVNRYWSYFTNRGIIDPVDDIRSSNPPTNNDLLEALRDDFINSKFDLKHLVRTIVSSHTYQRSFRSNNWNESDTINYSHNIPRRLAAEQLYDTIMIATGAPNNIPGVPAGFRATQLPDPKIDVSFLDMFGRPPRESPCECERSSQVSLAQTLNLINGPTISEAIVHPNGLIARLIKEKADNHKLIEEVYLSVICKLPTKDEVAAAEKFMAEVNNPSEATQDLMWALINSSAFLFNR
jgi:hypothetical protein